jgi:fluoride ion exporter CrcB/FEX
MVESVRLGELDSVVLLLRNLWLSMLLGFAVVAAGFAVGQAIT